MVNVSAGPLHETPLCVKVGVTVMVAVIGADDVFVHVNEGISPLPDPPSPIVVLEFVQA